MPDSQVARHAPWPLGQRDVLLARAHDQLEYNGRTVNCHRRFASFKRHLQKPFQQRRDICRLFRLCAAERKTHAESLGGVTRRRHLLPEVVAKEQSRHSVASSPANEAAGNRELYHLNLATPESHSDKRVLRRRKTDTLASQQLINAQCCWSLVPCRLDVAADEC